jgi:ribosome-binding ATPase YchF (GTP1/OBG family)
MRAVGIVGLPDAGAGTIFTALTAVHSGGAAKAHRAIVPVPDERVDRLGELHQSRKLVYAQLEFVDTSSMVRRGSRGAGILPAELLGYLRESDAICAVVRGFAMGDEPSPAAELADLELELVYADLGVVTGTLERGAKAARLGDAAAKSQIGALERAKEILDAGESLRAHDWDDDARSVLREVSLLTIKPLVVVVNTGEGGDVAMPPGALAVAGTLEAEVAGMDEASAAELLASFGQAERGLPAVIKAVYRQLDLITFLTAGDTESRAWEVRRGATAPEAAGVIHSDLQRGFIRAEVVAYDALVEAGSWNAAKAKGLVRQEGKTYVVQEGDVIEIRFAV